MPDMPTLLYGLFLAGAVYGGIRQDLKALHERAVETGASLVVERGRIDKLMLRG